MQGYDPLHDSLADPIGFLWDSGLEKVQATPFEVPQPPTAVSLMMRPQGAGALSSVVHEDKTRPVLLTQRHNNWINDVIQVVLACHSTIHKV